MSRLIRMDNSGHTTVAEWTAGDRSSTEAAGSAFRAERDQGDGRAALWHSNRARGWWSWNHGTHPRSSGSGDHRLSPS